ncbi:MAG: four helix bundle protein [Chitinophagales bacterium]|nr:four helix bundle protein [Bacteroidota bacterium]MCB9255549.1 four helix bundle protein [Chitinophagales bacterium]
MFDFEKLEVYQEIRSLNKKLLPLIFKFQNKEPYLADQLKRAGLSVQLNLAEGTGRMTDADKKRFYIMSRSSVNECVSILQSIVDIEIMNEEDYTFCYKKYEQISKMLLGMIRSLS